MYLGHSPHHAGNVALVLSLTTSLVSPQYHIIFDDDFSTVENLRLGTVPTNWVEFNTNQRESAMDENFLLSQEGIAPQSLPNQNLHDISWLTTAIEIPQTEGDLPPAEEASITIAAEPSSNEVEPSNEGASQLQEVFRSNEGVQSPSAAVGYSIV